MRANLESLLTLLDQVTQGANHAHEATQRLNTTSQESFTSLASLTSFMSSASSQATETVETIHTTLNDLHQKTEQTQTQITTRLDDLQNAVQNHANHWNKAVDELIDAVKLGVVPIQQLIDLYGDAQIGGQRLVDYLRGLDFTHYQDQIRDLIKGLHDGSVEIAEVQEHLGRSQLLFAQQLNNTINLFRQGAVTLKRVEEIVREIRKVFPDSDFSDLAEALYNALRKGD